MKARVFIPFIIILCLLTGCSSDERMYTATSTNWSGEIFIQTVNDEEQISYTFKYIGDDLENLKGKEYTLSLEAPHSEHQRKDVLSEDGMSELPLLINLTV